MLNKQQKEAVRYIDGPLLVLAGAGSGKTRVITEKIVYLIEQCGYKPAEISAVTFTNKAAQEMKSRISHRLAAPKRRGLKVMTFHTLGLRLLRRYHNKANRRAGFSLLDADDTLQLLSGLVSDSQRRDKNFLMQIQNRISQWKNSLLRPENVPILHSDDEQMQGYYQQYQQTLDSYNAVDFDDLITLVVWLLQTHRDVLEDCRRRTRYLLVDEYQDSNEAQYQLVKLLTGDSGAFTVVGDDFQSIYAWRGAKPENLKQLQYDFPRLHVIKLEQNYRSTRTILTVANSLMTKSAAIFSKQLWSELGVGELVRVLSCQNEQNEAEQIVVDLMSHRLRHGCSWGDYAILYRSNHQARIFEKVLRHYGVDYHISGGQSWFAKTEIKDLMAYYKILVNPEDDAALLRAITVPRRGVGEVSLGLLSSYAQSRSQSMYECMDHLALSAQIEEKQREILRKFKYWLDQKKQALQDGKLEQVLKEIVEESGYEAHVYAHTDSPKQASKRLSSVDELNEWILKQADKNNSKDLSVILNRLMLIDLLDNQSHEDQQSVQLMTLHAAKGLEFPFVYLVGMEEEILPHHACLESPWIDEERRLTYVGITRAQKTLCLSFAKQRKKAGSLQATTPSRFIDDLPQEHLSWHGVGQTRPPEESQAWAKAHLQGVRNLLGG